MTTEASSWIDIRQIIFPIGYIYVSTDPTSPATLFGGSWTPIEKQFLYCRNPKQATSLKTGGAPNHTHTLNNGYAQICLYQDTIKYNEKNGEHGVSPWTNNWYVKGGTYGQSHDSLTWGAQLAGKSDSSNNLPPYKEVYAWERTA